MSRSDVNWEHLRALIAVARGGTLSAAAKMLGVKHSTVSRHLADLEQDIRTRLVIRSPGGLKLTDAGLRLLEAAQAMEAQASAAQDEISGRDVSVSGTVRVGAPDAFGAFLLAPRLGPLLDQHPGLAVQLVATPRAFNLTKREADIAIALTMPERGRLLARKVATYGLGVYGSAPYLARHPPVATVADLRRHRFINYIDDLIFTRELDYLDEVAAGVGAAFQSSNIIAQMQAAQAGLGLCILPYFLAAACPQLRIVLPEAVRLVRSWWLIVHEEQKNIARVRITADFITAMAGRETALLLQPAAANAA